MADSTLAFDILARDHASSAFDKVARSADKTAAALKKSVKVSDDVAKAEARLSKARDSESDALGRVHVAEAKLAEVRGNSNAKTSQIVQAEEQLSSARRKAAQASNTAQVAEDSLGKARTELAKHAEIAGKDAGGHFGKSFGDGIDKEGAKSGKRFGAGLKKWFSPAALGDLKKSGEFGGALFGSGMLGALKTPVLGPAIVGVLGAAVSVAAPAVGAIAAAGIVTGFGAGIATLGIVFAAKSKVVQDKWRSVMTQLGGDMKLLSAPFESTLIGIADIFKRTVDKFNPALASAFQKMSVPILNFVDQAGHAFERLIPAIGPITDAFNAVLKATGPALQDAVGSLSDGMIQLANSVQRNPQALADTVRGAGDLTKALLGVITKLNDANAKFSSLTGGTSAVTALFKAIQYGAEYALKPLTAVIDAAGLLATTANALSHSTNASGQSMSDAANKTVLLAQGLKTAGDGAVHAADGSKKAASQAQILAATFDRQAAATQKANDALTRQSGLLLTLSGSEIAYQQSVIDATAAVKENGKTHDITTQKGINNKRALDQVAASAQAQTVAMRNAGDGNVSAAKHAEGAQKSFVKLAIQMGYGAGEARKMAKDLIKIPNVTREAKLKANKADLDTKLAAAKRQLADPKLTATKKAKLEATIAQLQAQVRAAQAAINGVHGKTVTITTVNKIIGSSSSAGVGGGHQNNARAAGGPVRKGMPYWVGEKGPEPFIPDQNGTIIPNHKAKAGGGTPLGTGGGSVSVSLRVESGGSRMDDMLVELIRKYVRVNGGDVQAVLGR